MPFFRYQAREPQGRYVEGTIEADGPQDAEEKVAASGLRPISVSLSDQQVSQRLAQPQQPVAPVVGQPQVHAPVQSAQPVLRQAAPAGIGQHASSPVAPRVAFHKTKWGTNKDLMLLFSQFAAYLRSGINPSQAAHNLAQNTLRQDYREALTLASQAAAEGGGLSSAFEAYPFLFPPHVVGLVRAGEQGGFLPEACTAISTQAEGARKFAMLFKVLAAGVISLIVFVPVGFWLIRASLDSLKMQDAAGGTASGFGTFFAALAQQLAWPVGPIGLAGLLLLYALLRWSLSMPMTLRRHTLSSKLPIAGKRSWSEGMALFSWTLSNLFKSGAAPKTAVMTAAATVPNAAVRAEVERIGHQMSENTTLSQAFSQSQAIPGIYHSLAVTGEMTGDLPGQLLMASNTSREELDDVESDAKRRVGCWGCLIYALGILFLIYLVYNVFYGNVFKMMDAETDRIPSTHWAGRAV